MVFIVYFLVIAYHMDIIFYYVRQATIHFFIFTPELKYPNLYFK